MRTIYVWLHLSGALGSLGMVAMATALILKVSEGKKVTYLRIIYRNGSDTFGINLTETGN